MDASGFMAVFAVSGSVAFLAMHAHKRLLSHFFTQLEQFQIKNSQVKLDGEHKKKKVKFANGTAVAMVKMKAAGGDEESLEGMPQNWQVMYKGILQCRKLKEGRMMV